MPTRPTTAATMIVGLAASWLPTATTAAFAQEGEYDVHVERNVMVGMRDGTRLATDIYRPARDGRVVEGVFPGLLHRTPYDKSAAAAEEEIEYFVRHGYVVAVQDTRGRYESEGVFSKYYDYDAYDGYDTIEWLAALPYVEPPIGMFGTSYAAHTQADPAKLDPPSLGPLVLNMGGMSNAWDHSVRFDGTFEVGRQLTWAWGQVLEETDDPVVRELFETEKVVAWYDALPLRKGLSPLSIAPNFEDYVLDMATRSDYDDYWRTLGRNWEEYYAQTADVPMLHVGGWYDIYLRGTIANYQALSKMKEGPIRLLIGPWTHGGNARSFAGDVEFGPEAGIRDFATGFHWRWFDHFLEGEANGVEDEAPIRLFVMGTGDGHRDGNGRLVHGGYWRDADAWPLEGTRFTDYYFHADGSLSTTPPVADEEPSTTYTFDPSDPVPTIGGGVSTRLKDGAFDQREREDFPPSKPPYLPLRVRPDVVVFQTAPLQKDVEVIGPIVVTLYASSTAVDTDFTVKLVDVYPPSTDFPTGFDMNLTDGVIRARYRDTRDHAELMVPGTVYEFTIRPFPTANVFKRGHRIRIDVSSSNFPRFDVNPNTGEPLGRNRRQITADQTIHHAPGHASHVVLPVIPAGH